MNIASYFLTFAVLFWICSEVYFIKKFPNTVQPIKVALGKSAIYFTSAIIFGLLLSGKHDSYEYFNGYFIELLLSVDNVFAFLLIFKSFGLPRTLYNNALLYGIAGTVVTRFPLLAFGRELLDSFEFLLLIFACILIFSGIKMLFHSDSEETPPNKMANFLYRKFNILGSFEGTKLFLRRNGKLFATKMFVVVVLLSSADLIFSVDSIPVMLTVTNSNFVMYGANIFAIIILRSMFTIIESATQKMQYLNYGLSVILVFIGVKIVINFFHHGLITSSMSLGFVVIVLALSGLASLIPSPAIKERQ